MDELTQIREAAEAIRRTAPEAATMDRADSILAALSRLEARETEAPQDAPASNFLLALALEYATQPDKQRWQLDRERVKAILDEHLYCARLAFAPKTVAYEAMALLVAASRTAMDSEMYFCESDAIQTLKSNGYTVTEP